ncbi:uncharacterized protein LOC62_02G002995 [Vanrija pseudolonga]|uniref:Uncharacterized protein n=1 Tax=Vanrija pseudolonga TaxID=143232 RepID=A0AAF0Y369_9TREE|nr:hypothetical protein LOC62_02G002995 [Vanrija pseudolonga]
MSSTFPQLLKRSAFVTHDPLIARVYASNVRSMQKYEDYGLKFPVHRTKGGRYIKVGTLDGGPGVDAMWSSGEKEMRFIDTWGDGTVPWSKTAKTAKVARASIYAEDTVAEPEKKEFIANVDAMTEPEFEKYVEHIRSHRHELREALWAETTAPAPDESTLAHAAARGIARQTAAAEFQSGLTTAALADPSSSRLQGSPHELHGLAYSSAPAAGAAADPARAHKGRALDRIARPGKSHLGIEGTNADFVVGLGGLTAISRTGAVRVTDRPSLTQFDYKRSSKKAGIADFKVAEAEIMKPASVIGLTQRTGRDAVWLGLSHSTLRTPGALDSFRFHIKVDEADTDAPVPGSRAWVGKDTASAAPATAAEGALGVLGGPRATRVQGQGAEAVRRIQAQTSRTAINNLLNRITKQPPQ